jgi:hypothetical protein
MEHRVQAACHCGDLRFVLTASRSPADLPYRVCHCEHCSRRRPIYTSDPAGAVAFDLAPGGSLLRYRFATATADFVSCARCGCLAAALCLIDGRAFAVVNAALFVERPTITPVTIDAEGESAEARLQRRARTWTPVTRPPSGWPT